MTLKNLTKEAVESAIEEYDEIGEAAFLAKYGFERSRDYWLEFNGKTYVSKAIAGAAHGYVPGLESMRSGDFHGGRNTVKKKLESLGFTVTSPDAIPLEKISPGDVLSHNQLVHSFGVGNMGGMRRNKAAPHLVIISDPFKGLYQDRWEGEVLHYTGMGKLGEQSVDYAQNRTLAQSPKTGERVYLFEVLEPGQYTYVGEVELIDQPYQERQIDDDGKPRNVWMFRVALKGAARKPVWGEKQVHELETKQKKKAKKLSDEELAKRAKSKKGKPGKKTTTSTSYDRDQTVVEHVKRLAKGVCDRCGEPAPFVGKEGEPYLECHHIVWLAKGGEDSVSNAVALCPNCHRRMHVLNSKADIEGLKQRVKNRDA